MRGSCRLRIDAIWNNRNLEQQVWEKESPKSMTESPFNRYEKYTLQSFLKYKSLYFPTCGPKLTYVTLYKNRSENRLPRTYFKSFTAFSSWTRTVLLLPHCFSTVLATNEGIPHIVGQTFLFPVDWSQRPVISRCVTTTSLLGHLLFRGRHDFVSALERDDKHSATKPPCIITM
jgi:hypothetical protein